MPDLICGAFRAHHHFVCRRLRALGVPPDCVEDACQEVFAVLIRRRDDFDATRSVRAYLAGICRGVASNWRRVGSAVIGAPPPRGVDG